ncbi:MAG: DEAD/DEAH box helicase, partial [Corynebacterium sp.]|nr:DEAD/DEAH box helicase [Corynebacterium sp.]
MCDALADEGITRTFAIQELTLPLALDGTDIIGQARTGMGKTLGFGVPLIDRVFDDARIPEPDGTARAIIIVPTRELCVQVGEDLARAAHSTNLRVCTIYGGRPYEEQIEQLDRGVDIIVGTPGRLIDLYQRNNLELSGVKILVLDEADEMLQMGFQEDVERILADTPDDKQVALFSATMPAAIRRLSKQYLTEPEEITVKSQTRTADNIRQRFLMVSHRNKLDALTRILEVEEFEAMIMFVRTKHETEELAEKLRARGFSAAAINGDIPQTLRERTIDQLKDGRLDILVATDVAARGLDVDRISHVVNYDIPHDTESYVHRIGRTGRAGRSGEALLFVTPREGRLLRSIERATKSQLHEMKLPTVDEVNDSRKQKFADDLTEALADSQVPVFRELIEEYAE